jgi:biopolymer transport protein ExbD
MAEIAESGHDEGKKGRPKKQSTKVDLTPMVDLAFLLITFFMFTTTLAKPKVMPIVLPVDNPDKQNQTKLDDQLAMTILVAKKNVLVYYFGSAQDAASDPSKIGVTTFNKEKGIRKVIIDKLALVNQLGEQGVDKNTGSSKLTVLIKPQDSSAYGGLIDVLDEMHINNIKKYAIVDISEPEIELIKSTLNKIETTK